VNERRSRGGRTVAPSAPTQINSARGAERLWDGFEIRGGPSSSDAVHQRDPVSPSSLSPPTRRSESGRTQEATTTPRVGPVAVIGLGLVAKAALHALRASGLHDFHVADWTPDHVNGPVLAERGENVSRDQLAGTTSPQGAWLEPGVEIHGWPESGTDWAGRWLTDCDVCLLCADVIDAGIALEVNARCLEHRVPLVPGLIMGTVGQAGPVIEPGVRACLQCVDLRLQAATGRSCLAAFGPADPRVAALVGEDLAARALRLLTGAGERRDHRLRYHWPDGSSTDHPVLRTAHCPQCADIGLRPAFRAPTQLEFPDEPSRPVHILELQSELVDSVTGPIRSLERFQPHPKDPAMQHWVAALVDAGWARVGYPILFCGGNDLDDDRARAAALGEALERMSACQPAGADMLVAPYRAVVADAVEPAAWDLFDPATRAQPGFPYAAVSPDDIVSWTWGWSLMQSRPILVPASRVFVPFDRQTPADHADYPTLSGFATGNTLAEAAMAAVLETVERDALMIAWANRLSLPQLELDRSSPGGVGELVAAFADADVEVRCSLLRLDLGAPVVLAMARGTRTGEPAMVLSAAAGLDSATACRRALAELAANRLNVRDAMAARGAIQDQQELPDGAGHGLLYANPEMAVHLECWWDAPTTLPLSSTGEPVRSSVGLRGLATSIAAAGLDTIIVELTPPEVRNLGLFVVKALIPGSYPLNFDSRWPHLGGRRLQSAPVAAGLLESPLSFDALNRLPVPFP